MLTTFLQASAHRLPLADSSVHCIVTSPPYWGLRAYAGAQAVDWPAASVPNPFGGSDIEVPSMTCGLGLEPDPTSFLGHLVLCLREWGRVLRPDGTLWVNLGDSYAQGSKWGGASGGKNYTSAAGGYQRVRTQPGLQDKNLVGIPWRFALLAQAEGWVLRSDIVWAKPNSMPESVTDRPAKAHEYVFLLAKQPRYFYDNDAIREPLKPATLTTWGTTRRPRTDDPLVKSANWGRGVQVRQPTLTPDGQIAGANKRSVWTVAARPYVGAHFATFPEALIEPMIRAGTSEHGVCPACGAPWAREVAHPDFSQQPKRASAKAEGQMLSKGSGYLTSAGQAWQDWRDANPSQTTGWRPTCPCDAAEPVPATVLDPFVGSGTTLRVAARLGRRGIGTDMSREYLAELGPARVTVQMELL